MSILSLFYPDRCVFCRRPSDQSRVCDECRSVLPETVGKQAIKKGEFFGLCVSPFYYIGIVRDSILKFKFSKRRTYANVYAKYCAPLIRAELAGKFEVITWVPISRKRLRNRGYDQAELLAKAISKELGVSCVKMLRKIRNTPPQSTFKGIAERRANVSGAYKTVGNAVYKRILLIDDIITTGATLSECARTLLMSQAENVVCCTVAMAGSASQRKENKEK